MVITVVVCILCRDILMWMKTPEDIFEYSYQYIFIVFLGIPATYLYNNFAHKKTSNLSLFYVKILHRKGINDRKIPE